MMQYSIRATCNIFLGVMFSSSLFSKYFLNGFKNYLTTNVSFIKSIQIRMWPWGFTPRIDCGKYGRKIHSVKLIMDKLSNIPRKVVVAEMILKRLNIVGIITEFLHISCIVKLWRVMKYNKAGKECVWW